MRLSAFRDPPQPELVRQDSWVTSVRADLVIEQPRLDLGRDLAPLNLAPTTRFRFVDGSLSRVGDDLASEDSRRVALPRNSKLLAATSDLRHAVAVEDGAVLLIGEAVHPLRLSSADSAAFLPNGRLLVMAPNVEMKTWQGQTYQHNGTHRIVLLDLAGEILDEREVPDVIDAGAFISEHPTDGSVIVEFGMGQDGSEVYRIRVDDDRISLGHLLQNVVVCGFSPDGERLLVVPHPSFDTNPSALRWPELDACGEGTTSRAGLPEDAAFDHYGCYLSSDRVLLKTVEHGLLLGNRDLDNLVPIELPGTPPIGEQFDIGLILGINRGRFAAAFWQPGQTRTTVWSLPN